MSALLQSGKVGNTSINQMKLIREEVIRRWDGLGLLDGLEGHQKETVAQLFENEASWLINEATTIGSEGSFETVVFPIVRRVFSKLLANEIVSVQALNLPIGKLFYFIPRITTTSFDADQAGITGYGTGITYDQKNLYDVFYGDDGMYDKSKGKILGVNAGTVYTTTTQVYAVPVKNAARPTPTVNPYPDGFKDNPTTTTSIDTGTTGIIKITFDPTQFNVTNFEHQEEFLSGMVVTYGTGTTTYAGYSITGDTFLDWHLPVQRYGNSIMNTSGVIYVEVVNSDGTAALSLADIHAYAKNYENLELQDEMGEVSFELTSVTVSVIERKLRAQWSPELAQDVSAFHNIDAEAELTALLSEQIAAEIDREILRDLRRGAAWRLNWDYKGSTSRYVNVAEGFYTQKDWNQTLMTAINQVSAQIHKATLRGGANWVVCSAEISAIFDDLEYFHVSNASPEQDKYNMGIERVGTLQGRYQVYRDPYFPADMILIGHKGTSILDTGYIYAPYVPMQLTPTMYNPFTFAPVKGIMTRYAKKLVNNRYYGTIRVKNIVTFGIEGLR
jgi:hypothetical protein